MANKETTYTPEPQYLFGGLADKMRDRKKAREEFRQEKKEKRKEARGAKKASRVSKREDIKNLKKAKKDQIAEIKASDMTPAERRLAISDVRSGFREDKKARKKRKRTEIKGIKAARKLDKAFAKRDKLSEIGRTGGLRGKIAQMRSDRIDRRISDSKGKYGRWEEKMPDKYYSEGFEEYGGYKSMVEEGREDWRKKQIEEGAELDAEGNPISPIEDRFGTDVTGATVEEPNINDDEDEGDRPDVSIQYGKEGLIVKLLKKRKKSLEKKLKENGSVRKKDVDTAKLTKKKKLIEARLEKKKSKKTWKKEGKGLGETVNFEGKEMTKREMIKKTHKEKTEKIKKEYEVEKQVEGLKERTKENEPVKEKKEKLSESELWFKSLTGREGGIIKTNNKMKKFKTGGNMTIPNYQEGGFTPQTEMTEEELAKKAYGESGKPQTQQGKDDKKNIIKDLASAAGNLAGNKLVKELSMLERKYKWSPKGDIPSDDWDRMEEIKNLLKESEEGKKGKHGMKVKEAAHGTEVGHGILIMLGKKSDKKNK